ncbi:uncharacterized protein LOC112563262 isoform X3 [Pomacea canaliculata]|uniref:uncharacterized protein LOC112563262 isoform X3 n=1 Tax=Pomacea canaliculata TaxID=400727 RepID=UPI000D727416|nr:uncharacterized protein LOC112563262 isoform X3 [Pomacea canaliculata]
MDSGEERDVSQAPGDEDGGDSSSAFPEQDGDTAALDGQVQAGEDAETDENVAALDRCSEADNAQEGDDKDAHRADSHKLLRTDLDSSEEELTELSPLRDGGGDRIHTPLMTYQLFLEEDDAEKHEDIDVGDKDSEADGSVGQEGLEHHIEVHQEREEVEQEGVPPPAESQLLSIVDNERKDEKSEDYKDNQEDKGMPMSDDLPGFPASPGFAVDIKSPLVLLGHEGNDLEFEKYGKQDNDSQNSASDGLEQPVTIAQNVLLDVLEKVLASENNNVESGEEEHLGGRKSLSSSESPLQYPELEKVQLCSDDSEYDFEQYRVHSVPKQSVHDKDGLEGQELTGDFQEDRKLEVDQLWAYDSEDHKSDDSVPLGMRVAGSDVEEEEELKGESRVVYPVNEMAGAQGGDACQAQVADNDTKGTTPKRVPAVSDHLSSQENLTLPVNHISQQPAKLHSVIHSKGQPDDRKSFDGSYLQRPRIGEESVSLELRASNSFSGDRLSCATREMVSQRQNDMTHRLSRHQENFVQDFDGRRRDGGGGASLEGSGLSFLSGSTNASGSVPNPGVIPNFKTLQDQQLSWLAMYRLLEDQHRGELQAQHAEHQRMINRMQQHLEKELTRQQQTMKDKLHAHKEVLSELHSPKEVRTLPRGSDQSWDSARVGRMRYQDMLEEEYDSGEHYSKLSSSQMRQERSWSANHLSSQMKMETTSSSGRTPDNLELSGTSSLQHIPLASLETRPRAKSVKESHSVSEVGWDKQLRGGVYSTPMPISRIKSTSSASGLSLTGSVGESCAVDETIRSSERWPREPIDSRTHVEGPRHSREVSFHDNDQLSPRSQLSLREKHAKHLADLRAYYEAELKDLREKLSLVTDGQRIFATSTQMESVEERILREENHTLRQHCQDLQDVLDDANIQNRELQQKLQGLEIRAADYAERYEESQENVLKLKNRLEELHAYAKEREAMLEESQANEHKQALIIQDLYKVQEEQAESMRRDKAALNRLLDKYEKMEKEYNALKETTADLDKKLYETRSETVDLNKLISRLELENKRLQRDNDNLRQRLSVSSSFSIMGREPQDVSEPSADRSSSHLANSTGSLPSSSHQNTSADKKTTSLRTPERAMPRVIQSDRSCDGDSSSSPLLRAEMELRRLQENLSRSDFAPKLQPKKYSSTESLVAQNGYSKVTIIDTLKSPQRASNPTPASITTSQKPKSKKSSSTASLQAARDLSVQNGDASPQKSTMQNLRPNTSSYPTALSSPTRFDVGVRPEVSQPSSSKEKNTSIREKEYSKERSVSHGSLIEGTKSVDTMLDRIRTGEIVSRPQWEDVYTSLARPRQTDGSSLTKTQEEMLRERLRTIEEMERHYDELQVEKRKLESMLNKVPSHGRVDRKSRQNKEELENRLDKVDRELGSLRMTLKRFQVLKSTV